MTITTANIASTHGLAAIKAINFLPNALATALPLAAICLPTCLAAFETVLLACPFPSSLIPASLY